MFIRFYNNIRNSAFFKFISVFYIFVSLIIYVKVWGSNDFELSTISASYANDFPHYSDKIFYVQFTPRIGEYPTFSMLIFIIRDGVDIMEKGYFYPGFFYELEYPFMGKYFELLVATVLRNYSINLRIKFNEKANFKHFEIRYGEYVSRDKMAFAKDNYLLYTVVLYSRTIHLYIRTHIEMKTITMDGRSDGLIQGKPGFLECRGSRGYPQQRVQITGHNQYEILNSEFDPVSNTHRIKAKFYLKDDRSKFYCYTDDSRSEMEIRVFHHPTVLRLEPSYYNTVPNGSNVLCIADDGYPIPKIQWHFISGPFNYDWYFNIYENQLFILPNAPIGSSWTFKCVAENIIPNSAANATNLLFQFTIIQSSAFLLIAIVASTGTVLVVLIPIIIIVGITFRLRKRRKRPLVTHPPVIVGKELAFDPDTAGSLHLSHSTECLPDDLPKYQDTEFDKKFPDLKQTGKEVTSENCYV